MINKVILLGRLGKDPEVRYLDNGKVVANVTLATGDSYTDKNGNRIEQTEWHNLELWDNLAKTAEKYLKKGNLVFIEGKIKTDTYTDKEGIEKSTKKIRVLGMQMIGTGGGKQETHTEQGTSNTIESRPTSPENNNSESDDDLPF